MPSIVIVEDELLIAEDLRNKLCSLGHIVVGHATTGEGAVREAAETKPDVMLMDVRLRGHMSGMEAARRIREFHSVAVVYLTAQTVAACVGLPQQFFLSKPFTIGQLESVIAAAVQFG